MWPSDSWPSSCSRLAPPVSCSLLLLPACSSCSLLAPPAPCSLLPACCSCFPLAAPAPCSLLLPSPSCWQPFHPLLAFPFPSILAHCVCQSCSKSIFVSSLLTSSICVLNLETDAQQKQDKGQQGGGGQEVATAQGKAGHDQLQESPLKATNNKLRCCSRSRSCCFMTLQRRQLFITFGTLDELVAINTKVPGQAGRDDAAAARDDYMCVPHTHTPPHTLCICGYKTKAPRGQKSKQLQLNSIGCRSCSWPCSSSCSLSSHLGQGYLLTRAS